MKKLLQSCDNDLVLLDVAASTLEDTVRTMVEDLAQKGAIRADAEQQVLTALLKREKLASTAIGHSLAVPHAYLDCIEKPMIVIARLKRGINAGAPDGAPVRFVFLLLGPTGAPEAHLDSLASIARLMSDDEFRYLALSAADTGEFRQAIESRMSGESAVAHHETIGEGLRYSGRPFGGLIADVRRRAVHYVQDYRDGLNAKSLGSTLFLFFACLAPAIIFGGLMHGKTNGDIGAVEMILATCICGVIYALVSGQPLIILGGTGPMLIFTGLLYEYCQTEGIAFLPAYAWVGFWTGLILLVLAATDASCLMRFFTRFTDEIFAALISVIFIYEAVEKLILIFHRAQSGESIGHDVAFLSLLLALGTYYVASSLSAFKKSHLLVPTAREFLADFGPTIAILSMTAIALYWHQEIPLDPLPAPDHFQTSSGRPWLVPFLDLPQKLIWLSIIPALLCSVLVFLDQNITARLVNSPDNNLQKGEAYHLDLALVGGLLVLCSAFGLPWLVAATVRSLNHVRSLATTEDVVDRSGVAHARILHVRENRLTGIAIHLLIGASLLLLPVLKHVPLAVLFGLFLYMGVVSMRGNQFFERLSLWATDPSLYPSSHYVRRVPRSVMHLFTASQLGCLVALWAIKTSAWAILFPLFIALLVPIRFGLARIFGAKNVDILDAEENPEAGAESWSG
ncbi:MAG: mannitol/fructose-specific phosphotransferase system IIA component (Ntr-type) [Planctomycetota bacterium]